jgi:aryl-alcohol dehydrogenase-like predicted oxidoreductase
MRLRPLGRTGLAVSEIGFGCGPTAGLMIEGAEAPRLEAVARALTLGINYFDTAAKYGDGRSEANLGRVLRKLGARPTVATKVALQVADLEDIAGSVIRSVEGSRARLGYDRLDLVFLHNRVGERRAATAAVGSGPLLDVDDVLGPGGVIEGFTRLRERGIVSFVGCCAYGGDAAAVGRLIDSDQFDAMLVNYSLLNTSAWSPVRHDDTGLADYHQTGAAAAARGMGLVALRVLEGGRLTGVSDDPAAVCGSASVGTMDLAEVAVRFVLANPQVTTALIGFSDVAQVDAAVRYAASGALSPDVMAAVGGQLQRLRCPSR